MEMIEISGATAPWLQVLLLSAVATAIGQSSTRKLHNTAYLLAAQSLVIAGVTLGIGLLTRSNHLVYAALLSGAAKGVVVPMALLHVLSLVTDRSDSHSLLAPGRALLVTLAITALAFRSAPELLPGMSQWAATGFSAALALIMIGLYIMVSRRSAISQVIGLLVMENGIYLAAMAATYGMPLVVELGVLLDALLGVLVMGLLVHRMHSQLETTDTAHLRQLRG